MAGDQWPPEPFDVAAFRFRELDAWYSGDTATLQEIYQHRAPQPATHTVGGQPYRGGIVGSLSKLFWGQPVAADEQRTKMHLPLAADLAALSAGLLFGEAPQVRFVKPADEAQAKPADSGDGEQDDAPKAKKWRHPLQDRLDLLVASDEAHAEFLMGAEYAAALGGTYFSVAWDADVEEHVFPKAYAADCVIPEFRLGRLVGAKLWSEYRDGSAVFRLIEHQQPGQISYTLHKGDEKTLGKPVPVESRPETAYLANLRSQADMLVPAEKWSETITIATGSKRLAVTYMKNAAPVPDWRKLGVLASLGRSDLDGIQDLLDKADQIGSSLIRDFEIGEGRITVPESWLEEMQRGEGSKFDLHRQVYVGVKALGGMTEGVKDQAFATQFNIRVDEHITGFDWIKEQIASRLGYSPTHLGLKDAQGMKTASEVNADLSDSERTRDTKATYARPAIAKWARVALEIDSQVFGGKRLTLDELPMVKFAPVSQADPEKNARIAQLLDAASAAPRREIVRVAIGQDMDEDDLDEAVELIDKERAVPPAPDPANFTDDPTTGNGERPKGATA